MRRDYKEPADVAFTSELWKSGYSPDGKRDNNISSQSFLSRIAIHSRRRLRIKYSSVLKALVVSLLFCTMGTYFCCQAFQTSNIGSGQIVMQGLHHGMLNSLGRRHSSAQVAATERTPEELEFERLWGFDEEDNAKYFHPASSSSGGKAKRGRPRKTTAPRRPDTARAKKAKRGGARGAAGGGLNATGPAVVPVGGPGTAWWDSPMFRHGLLTKDEETALARRVQLLGRHEAARAAAALALGRASPEEVSLEEWALALGRGEGGGGGGAEAAAAAALALELESLRQAKQTLVAKNVRLVASIAQQYHLPNHQGGSLSMSDLVQEGCLGLVRAAEKFDPDRGFRFSTYATFWVKQRVRLYLKDRLIRLPMRVQEQAEAIRRLERRHLLARGRAPTPAELAGALGVPEAKVRYVQAHARPAASLDARVAPAGGGSSGAPGGGGGEGVPLLEMIAHADPAAERRAAYGDLRTELERVMRLELSRDERDIVRLRHGLDDGRRKSLHELGRLLRLSPHVVKRKERDALMKLQTEELHAHLIAYTNMGQ